jgi:hypothetical protein
MRPIFYPIVKTLTFPSTPATRPDESHRIQGAVQEGLSGKSNLAWVLNISFPEAELKNKTIERG